jgi:hypothetical protein
VKSTVTLPAETVERVTDALNALLTGAGDGFGRHSAEEMEKGRAALRELATMTSAGTGVAEKLKAECNRSTWRFDARWIDPNNGQPDANSGITYQDLLADDQNLGLMRWLAISPEVGDEWTDHEEEHEPTYRRVA